MPGNGICRFLSAVALFGATGAFAREAATHARTDQLKQAKERIAARASGEKGYLRARLDMERVRLGSLIDDLEAGRSVNPRQIDQAIDRANEAGR